MAKKNFFVDDPKEKRKLRWLGFRDRALRKIFRQEPNITNHAAVEKAELIANQKIKEPVAHKKKVKVRAKATSWRQVLADPSQLVECLSCHNLLQPKYGTTGRTCLRCQAPLGGAHASNLKLNKIWSWSADDFKKARKEKRPGKSSVWFNDFHIVRDRCRESGMDLACEMIGKSGKKRESWRFLNEKRKTVLHFEPDTGKYRCDQLQRSGAVDTPWQAFDIAQIVAAGIYEAGGRNG